MVFAVHLTPWLLFYPSPLNAHFPQHLSPDDYAVRFYQAFARVAFVQISSTLPFSKAVKGLFPTKHRHVCLPARFCWSLLITLLSTLLSATVNSHPSTCNTNTEPFPSHAHLWPCTETHHTHQMTVPVFCRTDTQQRYCSASQPVFP